MNNTHDFKETIDAAEQETKFHIITLAEDEDEESKRIVDDVLEQISQLYKDFRDWLKNNASNEEAAVYFARVKQESARLMAQAKEKIEAFQEREDVRVGKQKAKAFGTKMVHELNNGVEDLLQNEHVSKVVDGISDTIEQVRQDERVKSGIKKLKKGTLSVAKRAYEGLKHVLDEDEQED